MKLRCLIVDDEPVAREGLKDFVEKIDFLELRGVLPHALQAVQFLRDSSVDLLYLDIEMPDLDGLSFLRSLSQPPLVILTTAHRKYAVEGFELDVVDYLMKPITFERFIKASQKALDLYERQPYQSRANGDDFFFIKADKQYIKINYADIYYVESAKDYVFIYTTAERHMALLSLKMMEEQLPRDRFIRVHRSYLVSIPHIDVIEGNRLFVGNQEIPISRNSYPEVYNQLINNKLWKREG